MHKQKEKPKILFCHSHQQVMSRHFLGSRASAHLVVASPLSFFPLDFLSGQTSDMEYPCGWLWSGCPGYVAFQDLACAQPSGEGEMLACIDAV